MINTTLHINYAFFCDDPGVELLGSDALFPIDRRLGEVRADAIAANRRERFRKHFPHKYKAMSHYKWRGQVRPVPPPFNQ